MPPAGRSWIQCSAATGPPEHGGFSLGVATGTVRVGLRPGPGSGLGRGFSDDRAASRNRVDPARAAPPPPPPTEDPSVLARMFGTTMEEQRAQVAALRQRDADLAMALDLANEEERKMEERKMVLLEKAELEQRVRQREQELQDKQNKAAASSAERLPGKGSPFFSISRPTGALEQGSSLGLTTVPKASGTAPTQWQGVPPPGATQPPQAAGVSPMQDAAPGLQAQESGPVAPAQSTPAGQGAGMVAQTAMPGGAQEEVPHPPLQDRPVWARTPRYLGEERFAWKLVCRLGLEWQGIPAKANRESTGRRIPSRDLNAGDGCV